MKHIAKKLGIKISRKSLRACAHYRRNAMGGLALDADALRDFHAYESQGVLPKGCSSFYDFSTTNGYANGKWVAKLTVDAIRQDIAAGRFAKIEFMNSSHLPKCDCFPFKYGRANWFIYPQIKNVFVEMIREA